MSTNYQEMDSILIEIVIRFKAQTSRRSPLQRMGKELSPLERSLCLFAILFSNGCIGRGAGAGLVGGGVRVS